MNRRILKALTPVKKCMLLTGVAGVLAQIVLMRECLVVFAGNELTIATSMTGWLVGVCVGAAIARPVLLRITSSRTLRSTIVAALLWSGAILPVQILLIRNLHSILRIGYGELIPLYGVIIGSFLACSVMALTMGFVFPVACALSAKNTTTIKAVGSVYMCESLGSVLGGLAASLALIPLLGSLYTAFVTSILTICAIACLQAKKRHLLLVVVIVLAALLIGTGDRIKSYYVNARWRDFGIVDRPNGLPPSTRLLADTDSAYQNLALTESQGQFSIYANGQFAFAFPDPQVDEHFVHFVMAQNPCATNILLVGGNPLGMIPELLQYTNALITYVEPDKVLTSLAETAMPAAWSNICSWRVEIKHSDPVKELQSGAGYDAIILNTPNPTTVANSRFYAREFLINTRKALSEQGFICASLSSTERLQSEAVELGGSVYKTFATVFDTVLATAGGNTIILAGGPDSGLTFDRQKLLQRSAGSGLNTKYFRPEYFLGTDIIEPAKTAHVKERYSQAHVDINTYEKPTACLYNMMLWSRYSGSGVESFLKSAANIQTNALLLGSAALAALFFLLLLFQRSRIKARRIVLATSLFITGMTGMALHVSLIMLYQGVFGSVYSMIGLMVALFMLGLVIGSRRSLSIRPDQQAPSAFRFQLTLAALALGLSVLSTNLDVLPQPIIAFAIAALLIAAGVLVGIQFPAINALLTESKELTGSNAALADMLDHSGAAIGALITGVVLLPVIGVAGTSLAVAVLNAAVAAAICVSVVRQDDA